MTEYKLKTREEIVSHLREVKRRKAEWERQVKDDYKALMEETQTARKRIHAAIIDIPY